MFFNSFVEFYSLSVLIMFKNMRQGFTLIELLIVIALIAVLAGAVIISLNPARQFQQARDSERWSHVSALAGAVSQNITENKGVWKGTGCAAATLPTTSTAISSAVAGGNICGCLVPNYTSSMPFDPTATGAHFTSCSDYDTGYTISRDATTGRVTISATGEITTPISVTQ